MHEELPYKGIFARFVRNVDWILVGAVVPLLAAGLVTMHSFTTPDNLFFVRQLAWIGVGFAIFFVASLIDWRFLRRTGVIVWLFGIAVGLLVLLFGLGTVTKGALSRFDLGVFFVQPADLVKLVLVMVLAKYFSRRHVEIAHYRHIIVSGVYSFVLFVLVFLQPDFGSAIIIFAVWFGMILLSGISKKHLSLLILLFVISFALVWNVGLQEYQQQRILTFIHPLTDLQGAGYHAYQSTIAVGSGQFLGKGFGYGTQSRLEFLPEYETDFIFAAFAEEWGFLGSFILFVLFGVVLWRIIRIAHHGASNFETFFGLGLAVLFLSHIIVNVGMNVGLLPVTGITLPFMSYGGSHLVMEFLGLGMLMGMRAYGRVVERDKLGQEFLGIS